MSEHYPLSERVETSRLTLTPLTRAQFALFLRDRLGFAQATRLAVPPMTPEPTILNALERLYELSANYYGPWRVWATLWNVVLRRDNLFVGSFCFKGAPREMEAELAYYIEEPFRNRGFMSETLVGIVEWARARDDVLTLSAETDVRNRASQRALKNAGFRRVQNAPFPLVDSYYWRISVDRAPS